jgi:hypothetical protein
MSLQAKGDTICTDLKAKGYKPVWMEPTDDRIAIGFEIIDQSPTWTKAFDCDGAVADSPAFIMLMNQWKLKVQREIAVGLPSQVVMTMLQQHGREAVLAALETDRGH